MRRLLLAAMIGVLMLSPGAARPAAETSALSFYPGRLQPHLHADQLGQRLLALRLQQQLQEDFDWMPRSAGLGTYGVVVTSAETGQSFPASRGVPIVFKK